MPRGPKKQAAASAAAGDVLSASAYAGGETAAYGADEYADVEDSSQAGAEALELVEAFIQQQARRAAAERASFARAAEGVVAGAERSARQTAKSAAAEARGRVEMLQAALEGGAHDELTGGVEMVKNVRKTVEMLRETLMSRATEFQARAQDAEAALNERVEVLESEADAAASKPALLARRRRRMLKDHARALLAQGGEPGGVALGGGLGGAAGGLGGGLGGGLNGSGFNASAFAPPHGRQSAIAGGGAAALGGAHARAGADDVRGAAATALAPLLRAAQAAAGF